MLNKMPRPFLIFSQSDYLIEVVDTNSHTKWQTVQIQITWLLQKPTDQTLHCLQRQGITGFSRTRVNKIFASTMQFSLTEQMGQDNLVYIHKLYYTVFLWTKPQKRDRTTYVSVKKGHVRKVKKDCLLGKQRTHGITKIGDSVWLSLFIWVAAQSTAGEMRCP